MQIIASKEKYGIKPSDIEDELESEQTLGGTGRWRAISAQRLPYEMEWKIILHIWTGQYILQDITRGIEAMTRDDVSATLATLIDLGYVQKIPNPKTKHSPLYALTNMTLDAYVNLDFYLIGRSAETPLVAQQAVDYYRKKGWFVCFAIQTGNLRPDLVAYDYSTGISVSVEIESNTEVKSHPEHVRFNMKKWQKLGFEECHVWSSSKTIEKMHKELDELHDKIRTFVVKLPRSTMQALVLFGCPPENYWEYDVTKYDDEPPAFTYSFAKEFQTLNYIHLDKPPIQSSDLLYKVKLFLKSGKSGNQPNP